MLLFAGCSDAADDDSAASIVLPDGTIRYLEELGPPVLDTLDLPSATTTPWYTVASGGFAYALDVGTDGTVTLAYTAPAAAGEAGYDRSRIVHVASDGTLEDVACRDATGVWCFYPAATPGSARTWFVVAGVDAPNGAETAVAYVDTPGGAVVEAVPWGTEPAVSPDGTQLAWVGVDPDTWRRSLVLGDADGVPTRTLLATGVVTDISSPFFSADGAYVYYVVPTPAVTSVWTLLVPRAEAHGSHDVPADWWRVPTAGGEPEPVTDLQTLLYDGRASPDGRWFATATREGVLLVDTETGAATNVLALRTVRSLAWVP